MTRMSTRSNFALTSEKSFSAPVVEERSAWKAAASPPICVAVSVAALTIYDMCKALERGMEITEVYVVKKAGGRSGTYVRPGKRVKR